MRVPSRIFVESNTLWMNDMNAWPLLLRESLPIGFCCHCSLSVTFQFRLLSNRLSFDPIFDLNLYFCIYILAEFDFSSTAFHFGYLLRTDFIIWHLILPVPRTVFIEYLLKEKLKEYVHRKNRISGTIIYSSKVIFHIPSLSMYRRSNDIFSLLFFTGVIPIQCGSDNAGYKLW